MGNLYLLPTANVKNLDRVFWANVQLWIESLPFAVVINSGWRSNSEQAALRANYEANVGPPANRAGYSKHEFGLAVDVSPIPQDVLNYLLLRNTCSNFDIASSVVERWHFQAA